MEHTKLPWDCDFDMQYDYLCAWIIPLESKRNHATAIAKHCLMPDEIDRRRGQIEADFKFIKTACNNHYDLLDACTQALAFIGSLPTQILECYPVSHHSKKLEVYNNLHKIITDAK